MKKLFEQNSFLSFFDTLCSHLKRNITQDILIEYEIAPSLIPLQYVNSDKLSRLFLDFVSLFRSALQSGRIEFNFTGEHRENGRFSLVVICNIRDCILNDLDKLRTELEGVVGIQLLSCNDLDIKFLVQAELSDVTVPVIETVKGVKEKKILLVGASKALDRYKRCLEGIQLFSRYVKTGGEAFELLFTDSNFDIVIMDEKKEGISAEKFKSLLRNNSTLSHVHLLSIADFEGIGYAPFLEKVIRYMEGVAVSEKVGIQSKEVIAVFDHEKLLERTGGNSAFIRKIIALYCKDMQKYLQALANESVYDDLFASQRIAHAMKGASFSCCAQRMAFCASELEAAFKTGGVDGLPLMLDSLQSAFSEFCTEVSTIGYL